MKNYYQILGIQPAATKEEIKKAYKLAALKWHPDRNSHPDAHARIVEINEAYETLIDDNKRFFYDQRLNNQQQAPPQQPYQQQYQRPYEPYTPPRTRQYRHTERKSGSGSGWRIFHAFWIIFLLVRISLLFNKPDSYSKVDYNKFELPETAAYTFNPDSIVKKIKIPGQITNIDREPRRHYLVFSKINDSVFLDKEINKLYNIGPVNYSISFDQINTIIINDYSKRLKKDTIITYYLDADSFYLFKEQYWTSVEEMTKKTFGELLFGKKKVIRPDDQGY